jgi:hypothetical protein
MDLYVSCKNKVKDLTVRYILFGSKYGYIVPLQKMF